MPQTPTLHSSHPFHPVAVPPETMIPTDTVTEDIPRPTRIQFPDAEEPLTEHTLLGPFRRIITVTGLDCSAVALAESNPLLRRRALFSRILAFVVLFLILFRFGMLFKATGRVMSLQWAESNMFAFTGLHSFVCGLCLFGWTKNTFITSHLERLEKVRLLRLKPNKALDDYSALHKRAFIWGGLWFLALMIHSISSAANQKIILFGQTESPALFAVFPFLTFLACLIATNCVISYFLVNTSLSREIEYFNSELEEAVKERTLHNQQLVLKFCHRQAELLRLVRKANESLSSYASAGTIFCFYAFINAVYIMSFQDDLPQIVFFLLLFDLFSVIAMTVFTLRPTSSVQNHIAETSKIVMDSEEFEESKDSDLFEMYHILVDRSLKTNTRIRVVGGIPIYQTSMNVAMLLVPNLGNVLGLVKKVLESHGIHV